MDRAIISEAFSQLHDYHKHGKLTEAESDYIKIGNKIYPKNASAFGYQSPEQISAQTQRKYKAEKDAEAEAQRRAEIEANAEKKIKEVEQAIADDKDGDRFEAVFHALVPQSGKADTLAGELIRAWMKVMYRDWNDGDLFYDGYGLETCGPAAAFVEDKTEKEAPEIAKKINSIASNGIDEDEYTKQLREVAEMLVDYILKNKYTLGTPNTEDMLDYDGDVWRDIAPKYDFDVDTSGYLEEYIDHDCLSWEDFYDDLQSFVESCGIDYRNVYQWARDAFVVQDLSKSEYDELERRYQRWIDSYLDSLEQEFGDVYSLDDEEEDEYDDEDDEVEEGLVNSITRVGGGPMGPATNILAGIGEGLSESVDINKKARLVKKALYDLGYKPNDISTFSTNGGKITIDFHDSIGWDEYRDLVNMLTDVHKYALTSYHNIHNTAEYKDGTVNGIEITFDDFDESLHESKEQFTLQYINDAGDVMARDYFGDLQELSDFANELIDTYEDRPWEDEHHGVCALYISYPDGHEDEIWSR